MAIKQGRKSTKQIGSRKLRKHKRTAAATSTGTLDLDITSVVQQNRGRIAAMVCERSYVTHAQVNGTTLVVEVNLDGVPTHKVNEVLKSHQTNLERAIAHRVALPERREVARA